MFEAKTKSLMPRLWPKFLLEGWELEEIDSNIFYPNIYALNKNFPESDIFVKNWHKIWYSQQNKLGHAHYIIS